MNTHNDNPTSARAQQGKRRLLLAIGGGSIGLSQWVKPAINTVLTPAHAQTSGLSVTFTATTGVTAGNNGSIPTAVGVPIGITANVDPAGSYNYEWMVKTPTGEVIADFGGDQSPGATLTYTQVAGGVIIEVLVDNATGASGSGTLNLTVGVVPRPGGGGGGGGTNPVPLPVTLTQDPDSDKIENDSRVTFTATPDGGTPSYGFSWTVNGEAQEGESSAEFIFQKDTAGEYIIEVTVTDSSNPRRTGTATRTITVLAPGVTLGPVLQFASGSNSAPALAPKFSNCSPRSSGTFLEDATVELSFQLENNTEDVYFAIYRGLEGENGEYRNVAYVTTAYDGTSNPPIDNLSNKIDANDQSEIERNIGSRPQHYTILINNAPTCRTGSVLTSGYTAYYRIVLAPAATDLPDTVSSLSSLLNNDKYVVSSQLTVCWRAEGGETNSCVA